MKYFQSLSSSSRLIYQRYHYLILQLFLGTEFEIYGFYEILFCSYLTWTSTCAHFYLDVCSSLPKSPRTILLFFRPLWSNSYWFWLIHGFFFHPPDRVSSIPIVDDNGSLMDVHVLRFGYSAIYFDVLVTFPRFCIDMLNWLHDEVGH
jgi:hypothetical protein